MSDYRRIEFSGTPAEAAATIRQLPKILSGQTPDSYGLCVLMQTRVAVALLSEIQIDLITKSHGETGRDGVTWPPLSPATIAARRITDAEFKAAGLSKKIHKYRGILSPIMDQEWRRKYAQTLSWAAIDMPLKSAKGLAAAVAWKHVKALGAHTRLELFGSRVVDILRDTGKLFKSLSPGYVENELDPQAEEAGQVILFGPGKIVVGSSEKPWHHEGIEGRLPARPLWPLSGEIPEAWWPRINRAFSKGVGEILELLLMKQAA